MAKSHLKNLGEQIFYITAVIQNKTPALYSHLGETPLHFSYSPEKITIADLKQYLTSLTLQFKTFDRTGNKLKPRA